MTAPTDRLRAIRDELRSMWDAETPGEAKRLLYAAWVALNILCKLCNSSEVATK